MSHSVEASWRLYICMPAKSSRDRREDSAKEVPVPTTGDEKMSQTKLQADSPRSSVRQPLPSARGTAATLPPLTPRRPPGTPDPARPSSRLSRGNASALETRTRQLYGGYREKRATPTPTPARAARGLHRSGYPSRPARGSNLCLWQRKRGAKADAGVCTQASGPTWTCFTSSSRRLGRSALLRQGGNSASRSILGHRPAWAPAFFCT